MKNYLTLGLIAAMMFSCDNADPSKTSGGPGGPDALRRYVSCVRSGMTKCAVARDFQTLFQDDEILRRIVHWCIEGSPHEFQVHTFLYGRYQLVSGSYIQLSEDCSAVTDCGAPEYIILREIREVSRMPDDTLHTSVAGEWKLSQDEWNTIVTAGGDFKSIGLELQMDSPVENIELYIETQRAGLPQ